MLANLSLRYKFFLPIIGIIVLMGAVLTVLISQRAYENARKDALILAMEMADNCRNAVRSELQGARITAETLSSVIEALKEMDLTDREMMNNILKHTLSKKEYITAFCVAFAPDALDGKDKEFSNKEPHYAASGRYAPYWNKLEGSIAVEPLPDSDLDDTTGADWWTEPRSTKREMITDPYPYQVQGKDVMLTSLIFPVINKDEVIGIVASDIVLDKLQELASKVNPNNKGGTTAIFSNNSAVVAHPDKRFLGKDISEVIVCRMLDKHRDFVKIAIKTSEKYIAEKPVEATEEEIEKYGNAKKFLASLKQYAADLEETKLAVESLNPELAKAILNSFPAFRNYVDDVGSSIQNNKQ
ncbi:MAG: hypothetical protein FWE67_13135, partial [Planctomycetaceae bacterium]|nr:hypothetical protein [Planctomycetaceae bacterium]